MKGRIESLSSCAGSALTARAAILRSLAIALIFLCWLPDGHRLVTAQEDQRATELPDPFLSLSEEDTAKEEPSPKQRFLIDIELPPLSEDIGPKEAKQPDDSGPQATPSESELWQIIRELQQDFEMLKEEIAQIRSEFRAVMPKAAEDDASTKRRVDPFWMSDPQLEEQEPG